MDQILSFMDLSRQTDGLREEILPLIEEVIRNTAFSGGPYTEQFEQAFASFLKAPYFSGVSSGSDALLLALRALGVGAGDEVIVPSATFVATPFAVIRAGAVPVFADCDPDTWQIDVASVKAHLTPRTRAVIGVHLYGQAFPVQELVTLGKEKGFAVLEDCAQSQGTLINGQAAGTFGDAGCFSFYPGKNLGAWGEGGGVSCLSAAVDEKLRCLRNQGSEVRYIHTDLGYNMRMDGIQAAVLLKKLAYLPVWNQRRAEIVAAYRQQIPCEQLKMQGLKEDTAPAWYLAVVEADDREWFLKHMEAAGIHCGIHYPVPCHLQTPLLSYGEGQGSLPNSEYLAAHCVSLPLFPEMTDAEVGRVIDACRRYQK